MANGPSGDERPTAPDSATDTLDDPVDAATGSTPALRPGTVIQGGRAKAFRPLPDAERQAALARAVGAYERGDFFLAHELLEPAWMGTSVELERFLYQGLIKLAAAYVHDVRGNPAGRSKNLLGARNFLAAVIAGRGDDAGFDLPALVAGIDARLAAPETDAEPSPPLVRRPDTPV